jgi:hypothetical protein
LSTVHRPEGLGRREGKSSDADGSAPGVVCQRMHISIPGDWASNSLVFAISRGSCTATPSTPPQRSALSRHAAFPSRFRVQVGRVTQRHAPSEPLLPAGAIQRRVRRRNFAMCRAFPGSDYYGASAPSRGRQPATGLPCLRPDWMSGARAAGDGSHVHRATDRRGRRPADAPAASPRLHRSSSPWPPHRSLEVGFGVDRHRNEGDGHALHPGPHPPGWSRYHVYEALTLVPLVRLLVSLAGPAPSGSTDASRHCRGCSRPPRHPPDQAAPSFVSLLRQADGAGLSPPLGYTAPRGAPSARDRGGSARQRCSGGGRAGWWPAGNGRSTGCRRRR